MILSHDASYVLIADPCYQKVLLDLKAKDPGLDIKILDRRNAIGMLSLSYAKDPIPYLLQKRKFSYTNLKQLAYLLPFADFPKDSEFAGLKEELLQNGYLVPDAIGCYQLHEKSIVLFEDDEDEELKHLLKREGLSFSELHFKDIGYQKQYQDHPTIYLFPDKTHQFASVFSSIRHKVLLEKKDVESFSILVHDDKDRYFVDLFSDLFGIPCFFDYRYPLLSDVSVKKAIDGFGKERKIVFPEALDEGTKRLKELVDSYGLAEIAQTDFDYAFSNLMEIVKSESIVDAPKDGISATTRVLFDKSKTYYVTNFQHGDFYGVSSDKGLFSDEALRTIKANPSYVKTKLDKRKKENFFKYMDVVFFSRVELHLSDKIFPSQLLAEVPSEEGKKPFKEEKKTLLEDGLYTKKAKDVVLSLLKDKYFLPPDSAYRCYDNAYTDIHIPSLKNTYNITSFEKYYACPFKYYLDFVLSVDSDDPEQDYFQRKFGNFVHSIFENIYEQDYDFDSAFDKACVLFEKESQEKPEMATDARERFLILASKDYIRRFVENVRRQKDLLSFVKEEHEKPISLSFHSDKSGRDYLVKGRIDKLLYTRWNDTTYYSIIDYKTGNEFFDYRTVFLGNSLQLPLYCLGMAEKEKDAQFALFGIEKIFRKGPLSNAKTNSYDSEVVSKYMKINGIALDSPSFFHSIDVTSFKEGPKEELYARGGTYVNKTLSFTEESRKGLKKGVFYSFQDLLADAKNAAIETMDKIEDGTFPIAPAIAKENDVPSCQYCSYRDICFRKLSDIHNLSVEIKNHLGSFATQDDDKEE